MREHGVWLGGEARALRGTLQREAEAALRDGEALCALVAALAGAPLRGVTPRPQRRGAAMRSPPPPPRTKWTRRVPHPVLIGHAASLTSNVEIALAALRARPGMSSRWLWAGPRVVAGEAEAIWGLLADVHGEFAPGEPPPPTPPLVLSGHAVSLTPY